MKRVAIIVAQNFQDEEFVYPYYRIMEEGWRVDVATPTGQDMMGKYGVPARATIATADLKVSDFDCVLLPGGFESPDRLRIRPEVLQFVREMDEAGKLVAAICHGPWILISAGLVKGRKVTGYMSIAARFSARIFTGASTWPRLQEASQGWKQTRPQMEGRGFSRRIAAAACSNLPAEISPT